MSDRLLFPESDTRPSGACPECGTSTVVHREKHPHIGEYCAACGKWLRWVPKAKAREVGQ